MNKAELIEALSGRLGDRKSAIAALDAVLAEIQNSVVKGDKVAISGFGVFEKRVRAARTARNPRTGESVKVKKTAVPAFRPGATFKDVVAAGKLPKATSATKVVAAAKSAPATKKAAPARTTAVKKAAPVKKAAAPAKTAPAREGPGPARPRRPPPRRRRPARPAPARSSPALEGARRSAGALMLFGGTAAPGARRRRFRRRWCSGEARFAQPRTRVYAYGIPDGCGGCEPPRDGLNPGEGLQLSAPSKVRAPLSTTRPGESCHCVRCVPSVIASGGTANALGRFILSLHKGDL